MTNILLEQNIRKRVQDLMNEVHTWMVNVHRTVVFIHYFRMNEKVLVGLSVVVKNIISEIFIKTVKVNVEVIVYPN